MRAHAMFDTRTKARSLAFLYGAGALICVLTVLLPHVSALEDRSVLAVAALSFAMALVFLRFANRVSGVILHLALATVTVLLTLVIHYTHNATLYALIYTWPALYAFYFFSTPAALAHLAFIGAAYATVLR